MGPRSAHRLVLDAFELYRRFTPLFLVLAAGVIVPYEVIVLAATGAGPFGHGSLDAGLSLLLTLIDTALIGPLVSALHVHAVQAAAEGGEPRLGPIARQGLTALPVAAAATIMSWLGIVLGFFLLVVPGIILLLRWFVVAQAAAIEREGWLPALRRSRELTAGNYGHVIVFAIYVGLIVTVPTTLATLAFGSQTTAASFLVGVLLQVVTWSFGALATGLLYFDLRTRLAAAPVAQGSKRPAPGGRPPDGAAHSWDPNAYEDEDRPKGWYVDPSAPHLMRYWGAGDRPGWSAATRTPWKIRRAWQAARGNLDVPAEDPEDRERSG